MFTATQFATQYKVSMKLNYRVILISDKFGIYTSI